MKILIIEDNQRYAQNLKLDLEASGFDVTNTTDFANLEKLEYSEYKLVILDIGLPNLDGRNIIKFIKHCGDIKVIVLTSESNGQTELTSLLEGADDYITKPHYTPVLIHKVNKLISNESSVIKYKQHTIDMQTMKIDNKIKLTNKEYQVLLYLLNNRGKICSKSSILKNMWQSDYFIEQGALYTLIYRLRKKIESTAIVIQNDEGGYYIDE